MHDMGYRSLKKDNYVGGLAMIKKLTSKFMLIFAAIPHAMAPYNIGVDCR